MDVDTERKNLLYEPETPGWDHSAAFAAGLVSSFALATGKLKLAARFVLATTMKGFTWRLFLKSSSSWF